MKPKYDENLVRIMREIQEAAQGLPPGKKHPIVNRCSKAIMIINKKSNRTMATEDNLTSQPIADRKNAKMAIFEAMTKGRKITFLDSREFEVSEMHTTICNIRKDIEEKNLPYELKDKWITFGKHNKRCKEYWLERREQTCSAI